MTRWPTVAEQQDQFAGMLDGIAEVSRIKPERGECLGGGGPAGFPIRRSGELTNLRRGIGDTLA